MIGNTADHAKLYNTASTYRIEKRAFSVMPVKQAATARKSMNVPKNTCTFRYAALSPSGNFGYRKPKNPQVS
jgi:hypothetical protein